MSVLVTGASGCVGQSLCRRMEQRDIEVRAAVRSRQAWLPADKQVMTTSLDAANDWRPVLAGVQRVVHLAARVHVMHETSRDSMAEFRRVNVEGTLNLARQAAASGVLRFVFISSVKVNGESTQTGKAFTEDDPPNPLDPYGVSKSEAEQGLREIAAQTDMEVVIIRPPLVYGLGVKANFAALLRAVQKGWPLPLGAVHNRRSLVALDNLVDFILTCCTHPAAANQTFLVSDGVDVSTAELVRAMAAAAGVKTRLFPVPPSMLYWLGRLTGQSNSVQRLCGNLQVDISKARSLLGWEPVVTLVEGLRQTTSGQAKP